MPQIVQLKRSALSGKVPGTGSLNLGELAINTFDGKIYFRRSGSTNTVQEVITTNVVNTGSIFLTGAITASIAATNGVISGSSQIIGILSSLNSKTGSYATTGSNVFNGSQTITGSVGVSGDLTVLGAVNARQFNINVISSSVIYQSGSTKFGDTGDDVMQVTGSLQITGSQIVTGSILATSFIGSIFATNGVLSGSSQVNIYDLENYSTFSDAIYTDINGKEEIASATHTLISGSSQLTSSFDERYSLSGSSGASSGPNTFDFNLDPEAAGTVNFIEDSTGNTQAIARTGSFDVLIGNNRHISISSSAINVTTGSITANYMHLAKYISTAGDLDFNI